MSPSTSGAPSQHTHVFNTGNPLAERNTRWAALITAVMMVAEITGGWIYNSMALLADGWHMSSHTLALGLSVTAYAAARRFAHSPRFTFGTWKIEILGGYTSAIFLVGVALLMLYQSCERLLAPTPIHYTQAMGLATLGLLVNLACAYLLKGASPHPHHVHPPQDAHHHGHSHAHLHPHPHTHHDLNLRSAYLHVIADAATSILAILALLGGQLFGASWLDPVMGIIGAALVSVWAYGLLRDTGRVLVDAEMNSPLVADIRHTIENTLPGALLTDLHIWRVGQEKHACILALTVTGSALTPADVKQALSPHETLAHLTVELNQAITRTTSEAAPEATQSPGRA